MLTELEVLGGTEQTLKIRSNFKKTFVLLLNSQLNTSALVMSKQQTKIAQDMTNTKTLKERCSQTLAQVRDVT